MSPTKSVPGDRLRITVSCVSYCSLDQQVGRSCDAIMSRMAHMTHRLEVELESGGNLRYELGTPLIGWLVTDNSISLS